MTARARGVCRAGCGERLDERLIDSDDGTGVHYLCTDPTRPVEAALERAFGPVEAAGAPPYRVGDTVTVGGLDFTKIADEPSSFPASNEGAKEEAALITAAGTSAPAPAAAALAAPAAPVPQPTSPPPSTLDTVRGLLIAYEESRPRTIQRTLGPSELGTPCRRQIAAKLAGVPRPPLIQVPWAPMCGTAVHTLMEVVLERHNNDLGRPRWLIESKLQVADDVRGHGDAYDTDTHTVIDWKYTGTTARRKAARRSCDNKDRVSQEYRVQAHLYGKGHANAGRPVSWVRLVLLARSHDFAESVEWTEEYRPDIADWAIGRYRSVRDEVARLRLADVAATGDPHRIRAALREVKASPSEETCKWCPFLATACHGNRPEGDDGLQASRAKFAAGLVGEA